MFCILLANLRKQAKTPYNLLSVNEHFEGEHICWEKALDTTLDKFRGDGLYFDVLPIAKIIC